MNLEIIKNKKGFTLLEVLIAIFVLSVGVVASVDLILKSYSQVSSSEDKLTAAYLAAEGLEVVRNIRDNNWKRGLNWDDGLQNGNYRVEWLQNKLLIDTGENLKKSNQYGFNYFEGEESKFQRTITLTKINNDQILVQSKVAWKERNRVFSTSAEEYLFNWYTSFQTP